MFSRLLRGDARGVRVIEQQINLYQDRFREKRVWFSAGQVLAGLLLMLRSCLSAARSVAKRALLSASGTRSCGRLGPAKLGTTLARSSSTVLV